MNKVVFNNCFGGFSLSVKAVEWLAENGHGKIKEKAQEYKKTSDRWARFGCHLSGLDRHDPDLVRCVETLGNLKSSGGLAHLEIAEIKGNRYRIAEYDGAEDVIEPEDENYITIE